MLANFLWSQRYVLRSFSETTLWLRFVPVQIKIAFHKNLILLFLPLVLMDILSTVKLLIHAITSDSIHAWRLIWCEIHWIVFLVILIKVDKRTCKSSLTRLKMVLWYKLVLYIIKLCKWVFECIAVWFISNLYYFTLLW